MMGELQQFATPRGFGTQGDTDAAALVLDKMTQIGLSNVHYEDFTASIGAGKNVVGDMGSGPTIIVIGAHHDSVSNCNGAVDNAAGTAAMLETAQVLMACKDKLTQYKLRFVSFDAEEPDGDYWGSHAYVDAHTSDSNPTMINLDCLGYKSDKGLTVYESSSSVSLSGSANKACTYLKTTGMTTCSIQTAGGSIESDPASYYDAGKEYLYPIEDQECGTCNHCKTCADDISTVNSDKLAWGAEYAVYVLADSYFK